MNNEQFEMIMNSRIGQIKTTLGSKAKEYAIGDRLYNFKRAAEIARITPQKALAGMFMKHLVSVFDLVEGSINPTEHMVNEKIGDAINYLILLEAIFKEKQVNTKCVECGDCSNAEISVIYCGNKKCVACISGMCELNRPDCTMRVRD